MVTTLNFKDIVDLPKWRPLAPSLKAVVAGSTDPTGFVAVSDLRNNDDRHPIIYLYPGTYIGFLAHRFPQLAYNVKNDQWLQINDLNVTGFGAVDVRAAGAVFMPAQGPRGTMAAGATTTTIPLSTALPGTVNINQMANRGDGRGYKVRIIGNAAGSSGKTEERIVIANTGPSTTPTLTLDSPLSFAPIVGDGYEFLSGRIFVQTGVNNFGTGSFDILTQTASQSVVAGPTGTEIALVGLDELYVPFDRNPGEGFFGTLTATASAAASLTGQAVGGDAGVVANQYRNFQIRIVEDTAIPTAVGQRRNITSHTGPGASPVYTVPAWAVIPSATAKYVIENNGDRILGWGSTTVLDTHTYTISTNTWDINVTFASKPGGTSPGAGVIAAQAFSIEPDSASPPNARQSFIFQFRGGGTNALDILNIAGAVTGTWLTTQVYANRPSVIGVDIGAFFPTSGTANTQDPATMQGRYVYINLNGSRRFYRFDMKNFILEEVTFLRIPGPTVLTAGQRALVSHHFQDGSTKLAFLIFAYPDTNTFALPITR